MPFPILFLGGELEAAGFRLAGVATRVPRAGDEAAMFERARSEGAVLVVSSACARAIPSPALEAALAAPAPLVVVLLQLLR